MEKVFWNWMSFFWSSYESLAFNQGQEGLERVIEDRVAGETPIRRFS
jgi:hypothetical protein